MERHDSIGGGRKIVFNGLNALRVVTALTVVLFHYSEPLSRPADTLPGAPVFTGAYLGVNVLFMLSGFVLTHVYEGRLLAGLSPWIFVWRRAKRFYPLYALTLTLPLAAILLNWGHSSTHRLLGPLLLGYVCNMAFLPSPFDFHPTPGVAYRLPLFPLNMPAWSMTVELIANFAFAALARFLTTRRLGVMVAAGGVAMALCYRRFGTFDVGAYWDDGIGGLTRGLWSFFFGVLIYRLSITRGGLSTTLPWPVLVAVLAVLSVAFAHPLSGPVAELICVAIAVPGSLYVAARSKLDGIAGRLLAWAGSLSFALYITHWVSFTLGRLAFKSFRPTYPLSLFLFLAISVIVAIAARYLCEAPARRVFAGSGTLRRRRDQQVGFDVRGVADDRKG